MEPNEPTIKIEQIKSLFLKPKVLGSMLKQSLSWLLGFRLRFKLPIVLKSAMQWTYSLRQQLLLISRKHYFETDLIKREKRDTYKEERVAVYLHRRCCSCGMTYMQWEGIWRRLSICHHDTAKWEGTTCTDSQSAKKRSQTFDLELTRTRLWLRA